ncbi:hypothetical protein L7F22_019043 [Adiantum nelumboides]|nr:hypothetical protein [Adiantum nelumboides]
MSSRHNNGGDRAPPRDYRDLDRDRNAYRRSVSPSSRSGERTGLDERRYGHDDRDGRRYDQRNSSRDYRREGATSSRYEERRRDDRYSHRDNYSRRRQPSPPTRQARRDEEERKQKRQKEKEEEEEASRAAAKAKEEEEEGAVDGDEEDDMMKAMGFGGFGTTKGKKVEGNQTGTAEINTSKLFCSASSTPHLKMTSEEITPPPRFDFFQTATQVIVSVYVKGCSQDDIQLDTTNQSLRLTINAPRKSSLEISPLFGEIDTSNSAVTTLPSKVEISLQKLQPGIQWPSLQGSNANSSSSSNTTVATAGTTTASTSETTSSRRSKWDSFRDVDEEEEKQNKTSGNGTSSEGSIDDFFKQLYANSDDDTRKAMIKSYQESGGTALSTNWKDVKKGKVKTEPPKGMEARKW